MGAEENYITEMGDEPRAILTDAEKAVLSGEKEAEDGYRYQVRSNVRSKIERLEEDLEFLEEHAPEFAEQLREVVTGSSEADRDEVLEELREIRERLDELDDE